MKKNGKHFKVRKYHTIIIFFVLVIIPNLLSAQSTVLIDFGSSPDKNSYGLSGWNTVLKSSFVDYTNIGPAGLIPASGVAELDDYQGIQGISRKFNKGERIVVTWYNNSDNSYFISGRLSFTDPDNPNEDGSGGRWYTMRSFEDYHNTYSEIMPHSSLRTVFNITDKGVHKCDSTYSLVNVNLHVEWHDNTPKPYIVCDKIELFNDADIQPPATPLGLIANVISDSKIELTWDKSTDNVGVVEYLVYNNGAVEGYTRTNNFTVVYLEPATEYSFTVSALDKVGNESGKSIPVTATTLTYRGSSHLINPVQFNYLGAFRLPELFSYGGEAIAFNPDGDGGLNGSGSNDGFAGSLFVTDLNVPERGFVAEINIPSPVISANHNPDELNEVVILQEPANIRPANISSWSFVDIWKTGLAYVESEKRLYSSWSIYFTVTGEKNASISFCNPFDLAGSQKYGTWYVGKSTEPPIDAMANDYLFNLPQSWADKNSFGRSLITGRYREGGLSGLGPTLYAMELIKNNTPPQPDAELEMTTLLQYGSVEGTDNYNYPNSIDGYNHADWWRDACWIDYGEQASVVLIGKKALGNNWYGYQGENFRHEWMIADIPYPEFNITDPNGKGWKAQNYSQMIIFYNPGDFAAVAKGSMQIYEPQPYAAMRIDTSLFWGFENEISSATYDSYNNRLYVTEYNAPTDGNLIVHVWNLGSPPTSSKENIAFISNDKLEQNYPNPFNPETVINYQISNYGFVDLKVYDVLGRMIADLIDEYKQPGEYQVVFNTERISSGVYFYQLRLNGKVAGIRKMIKIK